MTGSLGAKPRGFSTICLPVDQELYTQIIDSPERFRDWIDEAYLQSPELFPEPVAAGYELKDARVSKKLGITLRRIQFKATNNAL